MAQAKGLLGDVGSTGSTSRYSGFVWLGKPLTKANPRRDHSEAGSAASGYRPVNADNAMTLPLRWRDTSKASNKKQMDRLLRLVSEATGQPADLETALEVWQKAVQRASEMWTATLGGKKGKPTTPWQEIEKAARDRRAGLSNSLSGAGPKGPRTTKTRSISELSDGDAWSVINRTVTELLGRAASSSEVQEFAHRANRIAANNPTTTTTTTKYDAEGNPISERSRTKQGAGAGDYELAARNQANSDPEAGAYQAAAIYYPKLLETLGSMANLQNPA